ncbi:copper resistance protein NlpE [Alistipes sp.]|uniref:copper resistance protein NlpE n=1 Tax=Alistipes sp. TaxID=1872444 RepID=UPI0011CBC546
MKTNNLLIIAAVLLFAACGGRGRPAASGDGATPVPDMHTAETSLDYTGTYTGVLPAADCPGIEVRLTLGDDGRYTLDEQYIDRDTRFHTAGRYTVRENLLTLDGADGATFYRIEENRLRMLTPERQPVTGELADRYVLTKTKTE